jgi:hypothetical protein
MYIHAAFESLNSQSVLALLKGVVVSLRLLKSQAATTPQPGCYNIQIQLLVLEHTGCSVCYNTWINLKLPEHTSVSSTWWYSQLKGV